MKKINLLSPEFLHRKTEQNIAKFLLVVIMIFLVYTAYLVFDAQKAIKDIVYDHTIDEKIVSLEESIEKLQEEISQHENYLIELKKNDFPYKDIFEFFAKRTPEGMMILAVFDQDDIIVARGIALEHRAVAQLVDSLESNLSVENIRVTELIARDDLQLFELQFNRKVELDE